MAESSSGDINIPWRMILLFGWMIATLVLLGRLLIAFFNGVRLLKRSKSQTCEHIEQAAGVARAKLGITKCLFIRSSQEIRSPMIWCWSKNPVLLVPSELDNNVDWVGVICHELAHWRRWDHISGLMAEMIVCILSWNPLLWWSKKRMVRLGEQACDDWVIADGQPVENYARSLLNFKPQQQAAFVPAVIYSKKGVAVRIRRILKDSCGNPRTGLLWASTASIMVTCIAVGIAFAQTRPAESVSGEAAEETKAAPTAEDKATATAALFGAIEAKNSARVKSAIAQGANLEAKNSKGYTPLHAASRKGYEMIRLLLEAGANPNARDPEGQIPLHHTARGWHLSTVKLLVSADSDVNARDKKGMTPVMIAFEMGSTDMFDLMVAHGATVSTDLMSAYKGDLARVQSLIENGKTQETFEQGLTLLHAAAAAGHTEIAELLLRNGLDVRSETQGGHTALHLAAAGNHQEVAELLLAKGADVNTKPGKQTPLHWAIREHHKDMIEWLLARGANPNADESGWATPLHWVVWWWDVDTALLLVSHGGDINLKTQKYPWSPLYDAVWEGDRNMTEALITKAGDTTAAKWAPFHVAVVSGDRQAVEDLLAHGADVNVKGERGWFPLHMAAVKGYKDIAELLIEKGAEVNAKAGSDTWALNWVWDEGRTPLHVACIDGHEAVVELLIANGAEVNAKTKNGKTALSLAKERGYTDIIELLKKHGAKE